MYRKLTFLFQTLTIMMSLESGYQETHTTRGIL